MSVKLMKFSPADWVINTRPLSLAAKGAWIDLLCLMWNAQNRGVLTMSIEGYARAIGATVKQTGRVVAELIEFGICEKFTEADGRLTLTYRRMVADEEVRRKRAEDGHLGGNPKLVKVQPKVNLAEDSKVNLAGDIEVNLPHNLPPKKAKPKDEQEVVDYCKGIGIPDGTYFWDKWNGNGFQNAGKPMKDWKATIRSWKTAGYLPSQKQNNIRPMAVSHVAKEGEAW